MIDTRQGRERARQKIRARIADLEAFDTTSISYNDTTALELLEKRVEETLSDVLRSDPTTRSRYSDASDITVIVDSYSGRASDVGYRAAIQSKIDRSCGYLRQLLGRLDELDEDDRVLPPPRMVKADEMDPCQQAIAFTKALYGIVKASIAKRVAFEEVGRSIGFDRDVAGNARLYATNEGWVETLTLAGAVQITNRGIDLAIEEPEVKLEPITSSAPSAPISFNIIIASTISGSNLQQGTSESSQSISHGLNDAQVKALTDTLNAVTELLGKINEDAADTKLVKANADTIKAQMESPKPNKGIIREALDAIREGVMGGLKKYTEDLVPRLPDLILLALAALPK